MTLRERITDVILDPDGSTSSCRIAGLSCIATAIGCAIVAAIHRDASQAPNITAIGAIGTACLFARKRTDSPPNNS